MLFENSFGEEYSVQVVDFVLDDCCDKAGEFFFMSLACFVLI